MTWLDKMQYDICRSRNLVLLWSNKNLHCYDNTGYFEEDSSGDVKIEFYTNFYK